jgi:type II secretory pathway pseudopilin PulG
MGTNKLAGFTIIETMLFLAISGLLVVSLLVGVGASVNTQRYRDAAETFKALLQQQYADLSSVQNGRSDNWSCGSNATPSSAGPAYDNRGQSNCMLVGKYVHIDGGQIAIFPVVGYQKSTAIQPNDVASLAANYVLNASTAEVERSSMEWGTQIAEPVVINNSPNPLPPTPHKLGILFIRSPDSGQIYTFSNNDPNVPDEASIDSATFTSLLVAGNTNPGQAARLICVDSGGLFASNDRGVYMNSYATGASAIELRTNDYMTTMNQGMKC